jgi:hypothetical protein
VRRDATGKDEEPTRKTRTRTFPRDDFETRISRERGKRTDVVDRTRGEKLAIYFVLQYFSEPHLRERRRLGVCPRVRELRHGHALAPGFFLE